MRRYLCSKKLIDSFPVDEPVKFMRVGKLKKYRDIGNFSNVLEVGIDPSADTGLTFLWESTFFQKEQDIVLEIGCGWGEYTIGLAERHPDKNYIGIDIKGARIWKGAGDAREKGLSNVLFVRIQAQKLADFFPEKSISEIWITFPDPHMKNISRGINRRLTSRSYLARYRTILTEGGTVHLKTDSEELTRFTRSEIEKVSGRISVDRADIHSDETADSTLREIRTRYEKRFLDLSKPIHYLQFIL